MGGAEESSIEQAKSLFDVNLFGVMRTTRAILPVMRRQKRGRIVNISSVMGLIPAPYMAVYASSKHALEGYSESLDHEIRDAVSEWCSSNPRTHGRRSRAISSRLTNSSMHTRPHARTRRPSCAT
jgi:short-subunit dehydrogenase